MAEAAVHGLLEVHVEHGVLEVSPVQMRVDAEHLPEDGLTDIEEVLGEAAALADPVVFGCLGRVGGADRRVVCEGHTRRVGREDLLVVDLARDITLDEGEVLVRRDFTRLEAGVEPREGVVPAWVDTELDTRKFLPLGFAGCP